MLAFFHSVFYTQDCGMSPVEFHSAGEEKNDKGNKLNSTTAVVVCGREQKDRVYRKQEGLNIS